MMAIFLSSSRSSSQAVSTNAIGLAYVIRFSFLDDGSLSPAPVSPR
jgi:hypothetical protein